MFKKICKKIFNRNMEEYEINMDELEKKQQRGATIVDVRSLQEYNEGHLKGAINIPYYEIDKNICNILYDTKREIVVYCQTGSRSKCAYRKLTKLKYENVYNLYGGLDNWL